MRKGHLSSERLEQCTAGERALALALHRTGHQVTWREIKAAWDEANTGQGIKIPSRPRWTRMFAPAVEAGRVLQTSVGGSFFYTLASGLAYDIPVKEFSYTEKRLAIAAAAERALALGLERAGEQVTWAETRAVWCEANGTEEAPYPSVVSWGWVFAPSCEAGRVLQTRSQGFTFYRLANGPDYSIPNKRPRFTPKRLAGAEAAERALALALKNTGYQVTWTDVCSAWEAANGCHPPIESLANWNNISQPLLDLDRIRKTPRGTYVYYCIVDGPDYALPPETNEYTEERLARCRAAEAALALALERAKARVSWQDILNAWGDANQDNVVARPKNQKNLIYGLEPAFRDARVIAEKRATISYYTLSDGLDYPFPEKKAGPRVYGGRILARSTAAERALALAVEVAGTMVKVAALYQVWERANRLPPPARGHNLLRNLEPAIEAGRVRVITLNQHNYLAPAGRPDLEPPPYASDSHRVEEALRRASSRLRSAVLFEEITVEIEADPLLRLQGDAPPAAYISRIIAKGSVRMVPHLTRGRETLQYYTPAGGPRWVRPEAEHHLDRRFRAFIGLWRAAQMRPVTTRALPDC